MRCVTFMILFAALFTLTPVSPIHAEDGQTRTITLAEGTTLEAKLLRVTEDGIEVVYDGAPMQLGWDFVDGSDFARERRALVVKTDEEQLKKWADWCYANAQSSDLADAMAAYEKITGSKLEYEPNRVVDVVGEDVIYDTPDVVEKPTEDKPRKPSSGKENPANPNLKKVFLSLDSKDPAFKEHFEYALKGQLLEIVDKEADADAVITVLTPELKLVKNPKFFGSSAFVEYQASCKIRIKLKEESQEKAFDSGVLRTFPNEVAKKGSGAQNNAALENRLHEAGKKKAVKNIAQSTVMWMVYGQ